MKINGRTHEDEDAIGILLPAVDHLVVFFPRKLRIHGKDWPRAVTEVGLPLLWLVGYRLRLFEGVIVIYLVAVNPRRQGVQLAKIPVTDWVQSPLSGSVSLLGSWDIEGVAKVQDGTYSGYSWNGHLRTPGNHAYCVTHSLWQQHGTVLQPETLNHDELPFVGL